MEKDLAAERALFLEFSELLFEINRWLFLESMPKSPALPSEMSLLRLFEQFDEDDSEKSKTELISAPRSVKDMLVPLLSECDCRRGCCIISPLTFLRRLSSSAVLIIAARLELSIEDVLDEGT